MVPEGWTPSQVGDIAKFFSGGTPSKKCPEYWGGTEPWISGKDLKTHYLESSIDTLTEAGFQTAKKAPKGSTLILVRGMTLLKDFPVGYATREVAFNQDLKALVPYKNVDGLFLSFLLVAEKPKILRLVSTAGHGTGRLDTHSIRDYPINLPPLPEQKKIAQILSTWDKAITTTEQLLANSLQQKKALMQQLLTGKKRLRDKNGVRFSGEWLYLEIGEFLCESRIPSTSNNPSRRLTVKLNLRGVEARAVRGTEAVDSTAHFVRRSGQFIYGKQNIHKGAFGIIPESLDGFETSQDLPAFDFTGKCDSSWFFHFMTQEHFFTSLENKMSGTGSKRLNPKAFFKVKIVCPALEEQQKIAAVLSAADKEIEIIQKQLDQLKQEKKALMQQLLTGKRRVLV
ncbi:type I restriction enzyme, S subunit [Microbulbifer thermotolerans]|uniref:restriction endonuclease subunit S n=1 Tax=Microbulbifer thermotolerans TaxID=252514 RepID=UPI0008EC28D9|nr:restriction endonuclease subunit S [Microbulbifer thermotolerans]SFB70981.1 type I restriction enzyme, S subunit [Microbulbifer thermotolerans]